MFGKSPCQPRCSKVSDSNVGGSLRKDSESNSGDRVATEHIVSTQSGLVAQEKGLPTRGRLWGATVFVDCATNWATVQLIQATSRESTLEAKNVFEQDYMTCGELRLRDITQITTYTLKIHSNMITKPSFRVLHAVELELISKLEYQIQI